MSDLVDRMRSQIREALPGMVADELLEALKAGIEAQARISKLEKYNQDLTQAKQALEAKILDQEHVESVRKYNDEWKDKLSAKEVEFKHKEEMLVLREKLTEDKALFVRAVIGDVFSNNRFKYHVSGYVPVPIEGQPASQYGCGMSGSVGTGMVDKTVEGEQ